MPDFVVVVGPHGEETHTVANARDLVLHVSGYSYGNGKAASPVDGAPYAVSAPPAGSRAQTVLDRYGGGPNAQPTAEAPAAPVVFKAAAPAEAPAATPVVAAAPVVEAPAAAPVLSDDDAALLEDEKLAGMVPADAATPIKEEPAAEAKDEGDAKPARAQRAPKERN